MSKLEDLRHRIDAREARIGVIGLGYVGLPLALELANAGFRVTGFDIDLTKIRSLAHQVNIGKLPRDFAMSDDPARMVPIVVDPADFLVLVSGDPLRTNAQAFAHNGYLGFPTAKQIELPQDWEARVGNSCIE